MSESKYFGPEKEDRFFIELLITKVHRIFVTKELLKEIVETHLGHIAAEHANMAMIGYGRSRRMRKDGKQPTPMDLFDMLQTMAWDEILDRPLAALNGLRTKLGEDFGPVNGADGEMNKDRTATEWEKILGLPINAPTFLEAVTMWISKVEKQTSEDNNG